MAGFIIGEKVGQSRIYSEAGQAIPVSTIHTAPCYLVGIKTLEKDGYSAIKLGYGLAKRVAKPLQGELKKAGITLPLRFITEIRIDMKKSSITFLTEPASQGVQLGETQVLVGSEVKPEMLFQVGQNVHASGISNGKGFRSGVQRYNFRGGPKTHGQSDRHRAPGSIGATTTPGRVFKGQKMAGQMGKDRVTIQNLKVMGFTEESILISGLIPGSKGTRIEVRTDDLS